jgi:hypothetical protein
VAVRVATGELNTASAPEIRYLARQNVNFAATYFGATNHR